MKKRHAIAALALLFSVPALSQTTGRQYEYDEYGIVGHTEGWARRFAHSLFDSFLGTEYYIVDSEDENGWNTTRTESEEEIESVNVGANGSHYSASVKKVHHFGPGHMPDSYLGLNMLCDNRPPTTAAGLDQRVGKGFELSQSLLQYGYHATKNVGFNTALYLTRSRYWLKGGQYLNWQNSGNGCRLEVCGPSSEISQGWIRYWSLRVPFCLELSSGNRHGMFMAFGPEIEYRFGEVSKVRYRNGDKEKLTKDLNMNPLALNATARVGIDDFGIIARYSFTELFNESSPVNAYPFMVGIAASF